MTSTYCLEIIGHRGASADAPENTLASFKEAYSQGADGAELDIHLTGDGQIAVMHDYDLKRTGGAALKIAETPLAELRRHPIGDWGPWKGRGFDEKVPTLAEVLRTVPPGKRLFIEIKCHSEILPALAETFAGSDVKASQLPMITFHYDVAKNAKAKFPDHEVAWLSSWAKDKKTGEYPDIDELIRKAKDAGVDGLDLQSQFPIDEAFVKKVHAAGLKLYTWTVDDPEVARAEAKAGVDGITTNKPGWMRKQLGN